MHKFENTTSYKIGQRIKCFRKLQGVTLQYLGDMVRLSPQQIRNYETGNNKITIDKLFDISLALGISLYTLIGEKDL